MDDLDGPSAAESCFPIAVTLPRFVRVKLLVGGQEEVCRNMVETVTAKCVSNCWDAKYSVGITRLDDQHRRLLQMLNNLQQAMLGGKSREVISRIVEELVQYTKTHFTSEEAYFQMYGYPEAEAHKREHQEFIQKVHHFQSELAKGKASLSIEVLQFLSDWTKTHILGSDKKYGPFLQSKGVR